VPKSADQVSNEQTRRIRQREAIDQRHPLLLQRVKRHVEQIAVRNDADRVDTFEMRPDAIQQCACERLEELQVRGPFRVDRIDVPGRQVLGQAQGRRPNRGAIEIEAFDDRLVPIRSDDKSSGQRGRHEVFDDRERRHRDAARRIIRLPPSLLIQSLVQDVHDTPNGNDEGEESEGYEENVR